MDGESSLRERLIDVGVDLVMTEGSASLGSREVERRAGELVLDTSASGGAPGGDQLEQVAAAVLNAHLAPVNS